MIRACLAAAIAIFLLPGAPATAKQACDRACLYSLADQWLEAVRSRSPARLPLAKTFRYTENGIEMPAGEGLFRTATGYTSYQARASDVRNGAVAVIGEVIESDKAVTFATRLKVVDGAIAEAETVIGRSFVMSHPSMSKSIRPGLRTVVPPNARLSREAMVQTVQRNFDNLLKNDGSHFADDCQRIENRMPMSGNPQFRYPITPIEGKPVPLFGSMGCRQQVETHLFDTLDRVDPRRILVVDEEQQLVFGIFSLRFYGRTECNDIPGYGRACPAKPRGPMSLLSAEMLGVRDRKIHEVEVVFTRLPYDADQGWSDPQKRSCTAPAANGDCSPRREIRQ